MAERHPGWVNNIDAPEARLATGLLVAAQGVGDTLDPLRIRAGIRDATGFPGLVTVGTNKVTVNPFQAVIADPAKPADGPYFVTMDASKELSIGGANQSLYRLDLVVAELIDTDPGFQVTVYPGENSASPTPRGPGVTNPLSLVLAEITVPPPDKGTPAAKDTRRFTAALNGVLPVRNAEDRPANPPGSMIIYRLDTGAIEVTRDGAWTPYRPPRGSVDAWHPPALLNGWTNYGSGYAAAGYTITEDGWVRLRGLIKGGAIGTTLDKPIFQLPANPVNYRPAVRQLFQVATPPPTTDPKIGRIDIFPDGKAYALYGTSGWMSLDGISFATY